MPLSRTKSLLFSSFFTTGALFISCAVPTEIVVDQKPEKEEPNENATGGQGGSIDFESGGAGGEATGPSCATAKFEPVPVPLDLYVMMDRSSSMTEEIETTTKWALIKDAVGTFMTSPESSGIGLGMGFFPILTSSECNGPKDCTTTADCGACGECLPVIKVCSVASPADSCIAADYETPVVAIQALPEGTEDLESAMSDAVLLGQTPLSAAFDGAKSYMTSWASEHPDHSVAIVLATDGYPSSCAPLETIAAHAKEALEGEHRIKTFVIGVGSEVDLLDSLALAGGTKSAYLVAPDKNAGVEFAKALGKIRDYALACNFELPKASNGALDFDEVNVSIAPAEGDSFFLPKVGSPPECGNSQAWYYDDESAPTKVVLCPKSCEEKSAERSLEIVLGCATVIK